MDQAARAGWIAMDNGTLLLTDSAPARLRDVVRRRGLDVIDNQISGSASGSDRQFVATEAALFRMRQRAARATIERAWLRDGGPASSVGIPLDGSLREVRSEDGGWVGQFRGGQIKLQANGKIVKYTQHEVTITVAGIECGMRQEAEDEIYGVVTVFGPANGTVQSVRIPGSGVLTFGPPGARLTLPEVDVIRAAPVQDYKIFVALIEHDSGDAEAIARKVAERIESAAKAAIGSLTGVPAEAVADSQNEEIHTAALWVVGDLLGMGDDAYPTEGLTVRAAELMDGTGPALQAPYRRADDPRTIEQWTHKVILSGVDDGGDRGQYAVYLRVTREDTTHESEIPAH
jgi:hypothetical protein